MKKGWKQRKHARTSSKGKKFTAGSKLENSIGIFESDTAYKNEKDLERFKKKVQSMGIKVKVIDAHGPGGGWPIIRYTGKIKDLVKMIKKHWGSDYLEDIPDAIIVHNNKFPKCSECGYPIMPGTGNYGGHDDTAHKWCYSKLMK